MNLIDFIFSIYKDIISGEKTFFKKFYIFIFILLGLYLTDNLFGFSYYHSINAKIEKTREINTILKDSALLNKNEIISFKTFRNEIINRKTFKDNAYSFLIIKG